MKVGNGQVSVVPDVAHWMEFLIAGVPAQRGGSSKGADQV